MNYEFKALHAGRAGRKVFMGSIGLPELIIIFIVVLILLVLLLVWGRGRG